MNIQTNTNNLTPLRQQNQLNNLQNRSNERLSTGQRINRASDDAANLAVSQLLLSQIGGLEQAVRNTQDGASMVRVAEGAMNEVGEIMGRARELTLQAANDTLSPTAREAIYHEIAQVLDEVNSIARNTQFNTRDLLARDSEVGLQTGANAGQRTNVNLSAMDTDNLGLTGFADVFERAASDEVELGGRVLSSLVSQLDSAIGAVTTARAELGAVENRLERTTNNLTSTSNNLNAANSRIRDTDVAREVMMSHQQQAQQQASLAMMAHQNLQVGALNRLL